MTDDFDTLLRETLTGVADRAPDGAGVRAALDRRRSWPALAAVAAAVLLVAVAVPLLRMDAPGAAGPGAGFPGAPVRETPFPLTPTWLPDGLTEQSRSVSADGVQSTLSWHDGALDERTLPALSLYVDTDGPPMTPRGETIDLGGERAGRYFDENGRRGVVWNQGDWFVQLDTADDLDRDTLLRVARGTREAGTPPLRTALEFGDPALHAGASYGARAASGLPVPFATTRVHGGGQVFHLVSVELTPDRPAIGPGREVAVLGLPGRLTLPPADGPGLPTEVLVVEMEDRWLVVRNYGPASAPEAVRVAESLRLGPIPGNDWLGRR